MFGYVKPCVPELKVKEHELYRSIYCGVCRSNGEHTGFISRFTLSYDLVFLALVRIGLENPKLQVCRRRCPVHPLKKKPMLCGCEPLRYAAIAGAILSCRNLSDKIKDSRGCKKIGYRCLQPLFWAMKKKTAGYTDLCQSVDACLSALAEIEASGEDRPEEAADTFGNLLSEIFCYGLTDSQARIAREIGYHTGRWIYFADAVDDLPDDRKTGGYNPFSGASAQDRDKIRIAMRLELEQLSKALALLDFSDASAESLTENIVFLGMTECTDRVISHGFASTEPSNLTNDGGNARQG